MSRPFGGGIKASQNSPAGVVSGPSDGSPIRPGGAAPTATQSRVSFREQDCFLPSTNVIRVARKVLPRRAKISEDAKEAIQESASEYIRFVTCKAKERCQREQRKTITAEDVIWAMGKLGFGDYVAPLNLYLQRYREIEGHHRIGLSSEHFPIVKHLHHPQIGDTVDTAPLCTQPFLIPLSTLRPPPPSSLIMLPTVPSIRTGAAGYFLGFHGGGDGAGTSNAEAVPMLDFLPWNSSKSHLQNWSQRK